MNKHISNLLDRYTPSELKANISIMLNIVNEKLFDACKAGIPNMTRLDSIETLVHIQQGLKNILDELEK